MLVMNNLFNCHLLRRWARDIVCALRLALLLCPEPQCQLPSLLHAKGQRTILGQERQRRHFRDGQYLYPENGHQRLAPHVALDLILYLHRQSPSICGASIGSCFHHASRHDRRRRSNHVCASAGTWIIGHSIQLSPVRGSIDQRGRDTGISSSASLALRG